MQINSDFISNEFDFFFLSSFSLSLSLARSCVCLKQTLISFLASLFIQFHELKIKIGEKLRNCETLIFIWTFSHTQRA